MGPRWPVLWRHSHGLYNGDVMGQVMRVERARCKVTSERSRCALEAMSIKCISDTSPPPNPFYPLTGLRGHTPQILTHAFFGTS